MPSVGLVVPAYAPTPGVLASYLDALRETLDPDRLHVELDAPSEATIVRLEDVEASVHVAETRRGKGAAVTAGFDHLDTDVLAFADADGATPASSFEDVVSRVRDGNADLAVGSRRHPDAVVRNHQTVLRRLLGDGFAWLAGRALDVRLHDYQCGAKAITSTGWERVHGHLRESGFAWDVELVAIAGALDLHVAEIPIVWEDQPNSTVSPVRTPIELLRALLRARHRTKCLTNSQLHAAIEAWRNEPSPLTDRNGDYE